MFWSSLYKANIISARKNMFIFLVFMHGMIIIINYSELHIMVLIR